MIVTADAHLYRPGVSVSSTRIPPLRLRKSGLGRFAASSYAVCMSPIATVKIPGVGVA